MVNQKITYLNLDGIECVDTFAFNLGQQDFVRLELRYQPGIQKCYEKLIADNNLEAAYDLLTDLVQTSYGVREGNSFVKNRRINGRDTRPDLANFAFHPAFEQLMVDLMGDSNVLLGFFRNLTNVPMSDADFARMAAAIKAEEADPSLQLAVATEDDATRFTPVLPEGPTEVGIDLAAGADMGEGAEKPTDKK